MATFQDPVPDGYELQQIMPGQIPEHVVTFYRRSWSRMIAKRILGYLKTADYEVLKNKARQFTWKGHGEEEMAGPTILWLLFQICNPSTCVGVAELLKKGYLSEISKQCKKTHQLHEFKIS